MQKRKFNKQKSNAIKRIVSGSAPKSDISKYHKFIIVDERQQPMAWGGEQLCYCTTSDWQDTHFPIRTYRYNSARTLIRKSYKFKEENNIKREIRYKLMPVV